MSRRSRTIAAALGLMAVGMLSWSSVASADHHLVKIREFSFGDEATPGDGFLELQMYEAGQNLSAGHTVSVFNSNGSAVNTCTVDGTNGTGTANQSTVLISDAEAMAPIMADNGLTPDCLEANLVAQKSGGALCFNTSPITDSDCVAWGTFDGGTVQMPPTPAGTAATMSTLAPGVGLQDDLAYRRSITANCSTALDAADDTNSSAADFTKATPDPTPNSAGPQGVLCTPTIPPTTFTPPGNPTSPINPAGNVRKRKCKKKQKSAASAKSRCKKKK